MKWTLIPLLALMLLLGACGTNGDTDTNKNRGVDTARSFMRNNATVYSAETEDTIYFAGSTDNYIKYVDKQTGIGGVLCGKPECQHNDESCNAYMQEHGWCLFVEGERLYWVGRVLGNLSYMTALYSAELDGTDRRMEAGLPRELLSGGTSYQNYILKDGYLYLGCILKEIEDGETTTYNYLVAFPVDGKEEPRVILKERTEYSRFYSVPIHAYGDSLYFITSDLDGTWEQADESGVYLYNFKLRRYNTDTGAIDTLYALDRTGLEWMAGMWALDDGLVFGAYDKDDAVMKLFKYDFDSGECGEMFESKADDDLYFSIMDDLICSYRELRHDSAYDFTVTLWDFNGNKLVDTTYTFDQEETYAYYRDYSVYALGRDEETVYFALRAPGYMPGHPDNGHYITVIAVPLDNSGAKVLCTQREEP